MATALAARPTLRPLANARGILRVRDLRNKIILTLAVVVIYRLGANIACPGIDYGAVTHLASSPGNGVASYLNLLSGGALTNLAVFGLGIVPYITATIITQFLVVVIPKLEQWRDEGVVGQKKLTQTTR
jgi:preprotein translocase subunit SecY